MKVWYDDNEEEIPLVAHREQFWQGILVGSIAALAFVVIVASLVGGCTA